MGRHTTVGFVLMCLGLLAFGPRLHAIAARSPSAEASLTAGRELFTRYCASCHGPEGTGNGPVAATLKRRPADLTRIALRRGTFAPELVARSIDGRSRVEEHGPSEMPIWGRRFDSRNEGLYEETRLTPGTIALIVDYLQSSQALPLAESETTRVSTQTTMQRTFDALTYLLPVSYENERFYSASLRQEIRERLALLVRHAAELERHGSERGLAFQALSHSLADDAREAQERFVSGRYAEAQFFLHQITENCVACHSRLPSPRDFPFADRLLEQMDLDQLSAYERARLLVSVRQFEAALQTWEGVFADPALSPAELDLAGVPIDYLSVCTRVEGDLERPQRVLRKFSRRPDMPRYLNQRLESWIDSLRELAEKPDLPLTLESARLLMGRARALTSVGSGRDALVYDLVASGLLHRYVSDRDRPRVELAEAFYRLGVLQARTGRATWVPETESYLEAAIRLAPRTKWAEEAYLLLEEYTVLGYGGFSGPQLPPDVDRKLAELRSLLDEP